MTKIGCTMVCEQAGPKQLVRHVALAGEAWGVLRAAAQATDRIPALCRSQRSQ